MDELTQLIQEQEKDLRAGHRVYTQTLSWDVAEDRTRSVIKPCPVHGFEDMRLYEGHRSPRCLVCMRLNHRLRRELGLLSKNERGCRKHGKAEWRSKPYGGYCLICKRESTRRRRHGATTPA